MSAQTLNRDFMMKFIVKLAKEAGVKRVVAHIPEGVEVSVRRNQDTDYVFVQNLQPSAGRSQAAYRTVSGMAWKNMMAL